MEVTDVKLRLVESAGRMKAISSVTISGGIAIHGVRVIQGNKKYFAAMPSKPGADGEFRDIVHPINSDARAKIQDAVLTAFALAKEEAGEEIEPIAEQKENEEIKKKEDALIKG